MSEDEEDTSLRQPTSRADLTRTIRVLLKDYYSDNPVVEVLNVDPSTFTVKVSPDSERWKPTYFRVKVSEDRT